MANHTEHAFETAIEHGMIASGGYVKGDLQGFDAATALITAAVTGQIEELC